MIKIFLNAEKFIEAMKEGFDIESKGWLAFLFIEWETFDKKAEEAGLDPSVFRRLSKLDRFRFYWPEEDKKPFFRKEGVSYELYCYIRKELGKELDLEQFYPAPEELTLEDLIEPLEQLIKTGINLEIIA